MKTSENESKNSEDIVNDFGRVIGLFCLFPPRLAVSTIEFMGMSVQVFVTVLQSNDRLNNHLVLFDVFVIGG